MNWNQQPYRQRMALEALRYYMLTLEKLKSNPNLYMIPATIASAGLAGALAYRRRKRYKARVQTNKRLQTRIRRLETGRYKELKTYDDTPFNGYVGTTSSFAALSDMAQGDTSLTREGLQIQPRNLQYKIRCICNPSSTSNALRVIIFKDRMNNGSVPTVSDLLEAEDTYSFIKHENKPRFKIYRDMYIPLAPTGELVQPMIKGMIKFSKKTRIYYLGTGSTYANLGRNNIYAMIVADDNTNQVQVVMKTRLRFVE